jgi:hypothetical protein
MTIAEVIQSIDVMKPNNYSEVDKIRWLSELDGGIKKEIMDTHEGESVIFEGYDGKTSLEMELLVKAPYDNIYLPWLESKIDYSNGEYAKYNNSVTVFNTNYTTFVSAYNREHMPKGKAIKYF